MDLLEYTQQLVARGNTNHNSHLQTLKTIASRQPTEIKPLKEIKPEQPHQFQTNPFYLVGGLVLLLIAVLGIGY